MAEKVGVMIVEDNPQLAESISCYLQMHDDMKVTGVAHNALEAIEQLKSIRTDMILLDLVMPQSDGFHLLRHIRNAQMDQPPRVIVLSAISNDAIIKRACDEGALYYIVKPFSMSVVYDRIKELSGQKQAGQREAVYAAPHAVPNEEMLFEEKVSTILISLGIPTHLKGYRYLISAIALLVKSPQMINSITKQLYPAVGEQFDTSPANVERAIRHVLEASAKSGKLGKLNVFFGCEVYSPHGKFTSAEFLSLFSNERFIQKVQVS